MRLTLEKMRVENFKGCRTLEIDFAANRTNISGANGTGKTTIVDAFCWVLFNQNAAGDAPGSDAFREKPLDADGNPIHNLDTTVEMRCTLDGQRFDLKRTQRENWVKKRGNVEAVFQGNVSTYWINGVETKQSEFKDRVNKIADGEVFRLVGSLSAFNALEWKKRRTQLLNLSGNDIDSELLMRDEYRPIADEIAQMNITPDELRKVLTDRRKAINSELKLVPVRIDEATKSLPQITPADIKDADYIIEDSRKKIANIEQMIIDLRAGSNEAANRSELLSLEQKVITIKRRITDEYEAEYRRLKSAQDVASDDYRRLTARLSEAKRDLDTAARRLEAAAKQTESLRNDFISTQRKTVTVEDVCPMCGQPLPPEKIEATRMSAETNRKMQLKGIRERGIAAKAEEDALRKVRDEALRYVDELQAQAQSAEAAREAAMQKVKEYPSEPDFAADNGLAEAYSLLDSARANHDEDSDKKIAELTERKHELLEIVNRNLKVLNQRDIAEDTKRRIKGYEAQQQEMGAQLSETEMLIGLVEKFITDRCGALEQSINSHFPTVRWKLFDVQINGGIADTCICMIDCDGALVPYESANTASQIAADVEIVDVLSQHYDIRVPLFIDNAERINVLPRIDSQTIALSVSTDGELNIKEG